MVANIGWLELLILSKRIFPISITVTLVLRELEVVRQADDLMRTMVYSLTNLTNKHQTSYADVFGWSGYIVTETQHLTRNCPLINTASHAASCTAACETAWRSKTWKYNVYGAPHKNSACSRLSQNALFRNSQVHLDSDIMCSACLRLGKSGAAGTKRRQLLDNKAERYLQLKLLRWELRAGLN